MPDREYTDELRALPSDRICKMILERLRSSGLLRELTKGCFITVVIIVCVRRSYGQTRWHSVSLRQHHAPYACRLAATKFSQRAVPWTDVLGSAMQSCNAAETQRCTGNLMLSHMAAVSDCLKLVYSLLIRLVTSGALSRQLQLRYVEVFLHTSRTSEAAVQHAACKKSIIHHLRRIASEDGRSSGAECLPLQDPPVSQHDSDINRIICAHRTKPTVYQQSNKDASA